VDHDAVQPDWKYHASTCLCMQLTLFSRQETSRKTRLATHYVGLLSYILVCKLQSKTKKTFA